MKIINKSQWLVLIPVIVTLFVSFTKPFYLKQDIYNLKKELPVYVEAINEKEQYGEVVAGLFLQKAGFTVISKAQLPELREEFAAKLVKKFSGTDLQNLTSDAFNNIFKNADPYVQGLKYKIKYNEEKNVITDFEFSAFTIPSGSKKFSFIKVHDSLIAKNNIDLLIMSMIDMVK